MELIATLFTECVDLNDEVQGQEETDPDALKDPLYQVNLHVCIYIYIYIINVEWKYLLNMMHI